MSADVQATFCATLVDEWVRCGVRHAVVAPGSRSTPMALALSARPDLAVHVFHDERSAAFAALGIGLATRVPAALLCTSGTAATHFHAAVVEADLSGVPMLVLTADRPPELHGIGAPQTIDQQHLYGSAVRAFHDVGVPDAELATGWRELARSALATAAAAGDPGPVHLNLPFREPLVGIASALPPVEGPPADEAAADEAAAEQLTRLDPQPDTVAAAWAMLRGARGVIVAGGGVDDPAAVGRLADALGWPVLADPRSRCRTLPAAVLAFDSLLRAPEFAAAHAPQAVLHLGEQPASKVLGQWLQASGARHVHVHAPPRVIDPLRILDLRVTASIGIACERLLAMSDGVVPDPMWLGSWQDADRGAQAAFDAALDGDLTEPMVARVLTTDGLAAGSHLVVSSSMPVRDAEWFGGDAAGIVVHSNRGANGIDGVLAAAIGVAIASNAPTVVLLGDVAVCHDASSLTAAASRGLDLTIVVVDNDGGGIFSFLPQADVLDAARFEQLFGTPHGTDLVALAAAHGIVGATVTTAAELRAALERRGMQLVRIRTDRQANVAAHAALHAAAHPH
jgi:2-succinyl-5-enolpyruvyl-6-hydroxy-3-cyclohexene-1-carboxylate synthase